jgi:hypothetical protein
MKKTAGDKRGTLGSFPISAQVKFGLGLVGLIIPLDPTMGHEERTRVVLSMMASATSDFDMVPPQVLEKIEEAFYRKLPMLKQKFDVAIPLRNGIDFRRCFIWSTTHHKWEMADANLSRIKFTGGNVMLIVKTKPDQINEPVAT